MPSNRKKQSMLKTSDGWSMYIKKGRFNFFSSKKIVSTHLGSHKIP